MNLETVGGWFDSRNREALEILLQKYPIRSVLEIGSFLGLSAIWFAQRVPEVTCIDLWYEPAAKGHGNNLVETLQQWNLPRDFFAVFQKNIASFGVQDKIKVIRGNSQDPATAAQADKYYDLVYIDGDHSFGGCTKDILLYEPKARFVLCGDDYTTRPEFGVIAAVNTLIPAPHLHTNGPFWWAENDLPPLTPA